MANASTPVKPDPKQVENAKRSWLAFTRATKYSVIVVVAVLILMAIFLL